MSQIFIGNSGNLTQEYYFFSIF